MRHWWSDQPDSVPWTSGAVSLAATAALFAAAFVAMRTVRFTEFDLPRRERTQTTVVQLTPPVAQVEPPPSVRRPAPPIQPAPTSVPTTIRAPATVPVAPPLPVAQPAEVAPTIRPEPARDTSAAGGTSVPSTSRIFTNLVPLREIPTFPLAGPGSHVAGRGGAPIAPAGVTFHMGTLSPATRDSIATRKMEAFAAAVANYKPTAAQTEALRQQNEPGLPQYGRAARMPGGAVSVPLMNGGFSVVGPMVKIDAPVLAPGPSPAQRKRDEVIAADNGLRLRRLQDRATLLRDSIRADSLKRDSLARAIRP